MQDEMIIVFVIAGITVAFIGIMIWAWLDEKKRAEALEHIAISLNLSFKRKNDNSLAASHKHFELFGKVGRSPKISNLMTGSSGDMNINIMDYSYTVSNGKSSSTHSQTVIIVQSAHLHLPAFTLAPENFFHKIGGMFGYQDIDFASHPKFSKQYLLRGKDEQSIKETFSDEVLEFYEKDKTLRTEGNDDKFIYYKGDKMLSPKEIQSFLQEAINLHGLLKTQGSGLH